ncbi:MAG: alpha/beta hydrolase, partial [Pseudomonadota bacterium]
MPYVNSSGVRIHWQEEGSGPPLLLIMGLRYSSRLWYSAIPALAKKYRVISFDNRGTGKSGTTWRFHIKDLVNDAIAVMDAAGVQSAHVYGVSMGGGITMELAMRHPARVRSLILGCTTIKTEKSPLWIRWMPALFLLPPALLHRILRSGDPKSYGSAAPIDRAKVDIGIVESDPYSGRGVAAQAWAVFRYAADKKEVAKIKSPALILHGDEDTAVDCSAGKAMSKVLPNSRFEVLRGAGHNYFIAAEALANRLAIEFMDETERALNA